MYMEYGDKENNFRLAGTQTSKEVTSNWWTGMMDIMLDASLGLFGHK